MGLGTVLATFIWHSHTNESNCVHLYKSVTGFSLDFIFLTTSVRVCLQWPHPFSTAGCYTQYHSWWKYAVYYLYHTCSVFLHCKSPMLDSNQNKFISIPSHCLGELNLHVHVQPSDICLASSGPPTCNLIMYLHVHVHAHGTACNCGTKMTTNHVISSNP